MKASNHIGTMTLNDYVASLKANNVEVNAHVNADTGEMALLVCGRGAGAVALYGILSQFIDLESAEPEAAQA